MWAAQEGVQAGQGVGEGQACDIPFRIERLDLEAFGSAPGELGHVPAGGLFGRQFLPSIQMVRIVIRLGHGKPRKFEFVYH